MEAAHDWVLHGPFLDKTLMRNYMAMNFSGELMDFAPDVRFCEVILNGAYQGVYVMMETISRGKGRVDIARPNLTKNVTGYIVEIDNATSLPVSALNNFTKYVSVLRKDSFFDLVYPGEEQITPATRTTLKKILANLKKRYILMITIRLLMDLIIMSILKNLLTILLLQKYFFSMIRGICLLIFIKM